MSEALGAFVRRWYELWNSCDKEAWLAHWRSWAPGEPTIEDPVGTPVKGGWDMISELWDRTGPDHPKVAVEQLIVGGAEVAVVARNEGTWRGKPLRIDSIDVFRLEPDATGDRLSVRSFWQIPPGIPYGRWTQVAGEPDG